MREPLFHSKLHGVFPNILNDIFYFQIIFEASVVSEIFCPFSLKYLGKQAKVCDLSPQTWGTSLCKMGTAPFIRFYLQIFPVCKAPDECVSSLSKISIFQKILDQRAHFETWKTWRHIKFIQLFPLLFFYDSLSNGYTPFPCELWIYEIIFFFKRAPRRMLELNLRDLNFAGFLIFLLALFWKAINVSSSSGTAMGFGVFPTILPFPS